MDAVSVSKIDCALVAGVTADFVSGAAEGLLLTALAPHVMKSASAQVGS